MSEKYSGEDDDLFVFDAVTLRGLLGFHRTQDLIKFLSSLDQVGIMSHTSRNQVIEIRTDILSRLQGRDFKSNKNKRADNAPKNKTKNKTKIKNKNIYISAKNIVDFWNSKNLKEAKNIPQVLLEVNQGLEKQLDKKRGEIQVSEAISNYADVFHDAGSYYTHPFHISSFISSPKAERFYAENFNRSEYVTGKKFQARTTAQERQDNILNMENPYD